MIEIISALGGGAALLGIVYYCSQKVAEIAIAKALVQHSSDLSFDAKKREKAALVAELLSEWTSNPMDRVKVHRLLWEASMWLPDEEAKALNDLLAHSGNMTTKEVIVRIRSVIQGKPTGLLAKDLTHFP